MNSQERKGISRNLLPFTTDLAIFRMNNLMIPVEEQSEEDLTFMDAAVAMVRLIPLSPSS